MMWRLLVLRLSTVVALLGTIVTPAHAGINTANGNVYLLESDYVGTGPFPLRFTRTYNSAPNSIEVVQGVSLGWYWRHSYDRELSIGTSGNSLYAIRADGKAWLYTLTNGIWVSDGDVTATITTTADGYQLKTANDETETYNASGQLITIANRAGVVQTLVYDASGRLSTVTDAFGRTLTFTYDDSNRISTLTDPAGGVYIYTYNNTTYLASVTYPDTKVRTYVYNEPAYTSSFNIPRALTGIIDENNSRYAYYGYTSGIVGSLSKRGSSGAGQVKLNYSASSISVAITDALGTVRTYSKATVLNVTKNTGINVWCAGCMQSITYNTNGMVASETDFDGNKTTYTYDSTRHDLETSRTEGLTSSGGTTSATRTIATTWHATYHLPTLVTEKNSAGTVLRTTAYSYDSAGNLTQKTVTDVSASKSRTWTYTYNGNGSVLTADGPRTDISDVTTYTYYANDATCSGASAIGCRGQVDTITNALGQVTTMSDYNVNGQPLTITDPNGRVTNLTYDVRMRLLSKNVGGEVTSYTYDGVGQLTQVTLPDGSYLDYTYDDAHRLTQIVDNLGDKISYTLDAMDNRTAENVYDPSNNLKQTKTRVYNSLDRLYQDIGAAGQTTTYGYDAQGNLTSVDGPLAGTSDTTTNTYDALNRLTRMTDPYSGQTNYSYNALDQLTAVSDPRNITTGYTYNGLNDLTQEASPDAGTATYTYDNAGNVLTKTDAKGQVATYTYDALNRVTGISYTGASNLNVTYIYDAGAYGKGHLTGISDSAGTIAYAYDIHGRLITDTRTMGGAIYITSYSYDSYGRLTGVTYPGGRAVAYTLDSLGRIQQIDMIWDGNTQTIVSGVTYQPFGGVASFTYGGSGGAQTYSRSIDQDGRIASYTLADTTYSLAFDDASRITSITNAGNPADAYGYGYDLLDRLTNFTAPSTNQGFGYDAVGNRTSQVIGANNYSLVYGSDSNRIVSVTGPVAKSYTFDANGSLTGDSVNTYVYDNRNRLTQATSSVGTTAYQINSLGQRTRKLSGDTSTDVIYLYDRNGNLIEESDPTGTIHKAYVYLNDIPIAVMQ